MFAQDSSLSQILKTWKVRWNLYQEVVVEVQNLEDVVEPANLKVRNSLRIVDQKTPRMLIGPPLGNSCLKAL